MNAKKYAQTFNGQNEWEIPGGYFKLLEADNDVDLELYHRGNQVLKADGVGAGFYQRVQFDRVRIATGALEAVAFLVAPEEGGSDSFTGDFNLTDRAARLVGIMYGSLGQLAQVDVGGVRALQVAERGYAPGAAFTSSAALAANTAETIIAAASNPNGLILWEFDAWVRDSAGAHLMPTLCARATAPTGEPQGVVLAQKTSQGSKGTDSFAHATLRRPVYVSGGLGIFYINSTIEISARRRAAYTLL